MSSTAFRGGVEVDIGAFWKRREDGRDFTVKSGNNVQIDSKALPQAIGHTRIHLQPTHDSAQRPASVSPQELLGLQCRDGTGIAKVGQCRLD